MNLLELAKQNSKRNAPLHVKLLSLFSVVRGYNIFLIVLAQYLAAIFIFAPEKAIKDVVFDLHLFFLVLATISVVAAGYIINNFYDSETDKINRPIKSKIDAYVDQRTKLKIYFLLNFVGVLFGFMVSWRAGLFFSIYIFLIWFYSHKLKKYPLLGLFSAAILSILPFFAVFVYFKNFSEIIFAHAAFLFFILLIRQLVKDLENLRGDFTQNYQTIAVKYGEHFSKILMTLLVVLTFNPIYFLLKFEGLGGMRYYFFFSIGFLLLFGIFIWFAKNRNHYKIMHLLLKILIALGVVSLCLIDYSVIINKLI